MRLLKENQFIQFSVVSFVVMALIAFALTVVLSNAIRSRAVDALVDEAVAESSGRLLNVITPADLEVPMTGERYDEFHEFVQESIVSERIARVKLWAKDGTVIYSNDPASVGAKFPNNENLLKALRGENASEIKMPEDPENERERFLGTLMEVYTPIIFPGTTEPQGVWEIYQYYQPTAQLISDLRHRVLVSISAGFVVLYGTLVGGVWKGWRTIIRQRDERKRAEEALKHSNEFAQIVLNSMNDAVSIIDVNDFKIVGLNSIFLKQLGLKEKEVIGKTCYEITHHRSAPCAPPDDICPLLDTVTTGKHSVAEHVHQGADGKKIDVEVSTSPVKDENGKVIQVVHIARDITERKRMEEQLIVTDRLASVGELASGIAHELNNPLTAVIGFAQLLMDRDVADDIKKDLEVVNSEAQRAAQVVRGLLTFARKHPPAKQMVNINSIIDKVLELRAYEQRVSNIQVNTQLAPDLPEVIADYFQLQQVFLNIVINAEHFMIEAHNRGTLTITTEKVGDIIKASFADDGPGISKENLGHLFDPFFTTKEVGKGTGLGLSICHGIITEHSGRIYAESDLDKGATFIVELPLNDHS